MASPERLAVALHLLPALVPALSLQGLAVGGDHGRQILLALGVPAHHALGLLDVLRFFQKKSGTNWG